MLCAACQEPVRDGDAFCEACGADVGGPATAVPDAAPPAREAASGGPATSVLERGIGAGGPDVGAITCVACGGAVDDDGFCTVCGTKARTPRDHWTEAPSSWVAGVCDKGIAHPRNEDAMALASTPSAAGGGRGVLVVCDGVTTAPDSDRASIAAARAACAVLVAAPAPGGSVPARLERWSEVLEDACAAAHAEAVAVAHRLGDPPEPPSCTFVAAVVEADLACVAWCGDSRAYWLPDAGAGRQLGADHSVGTELIAGGMPPDEAAAHPQFHTITRWLGADSIDPTPEFASTPLDSPGWILVCSDGMWNYAGAPDALTAVVAEATAAGASGPLAIAESLAAWANERGGHDNITVALARVEPG